MTKSTPNSKRSRAKRAGAKQAKETGGAPDTAAASSDGSDAGAARGSSGAAKAGGEAAPATATASEGRADATSTGQVANASSSGKENANAGSEGASRSGKGNANAGSEGASRSGEGTANAGSEGASGSGKGNASTGKGDVNAGTTGPSSSGKGAVTAGNAGHSTSGKTPAETRADLERKRQLDFIRHNTRRLQNRVARLLGVKRSERDFVVARMLRSHRDDRVSYWFQLVLAVGIATIGLVLNSTGVVIGAMLISPLMGPLVGLGMGLAVGSPFLTLRSAVRVGASIGGVILMAACLTVLLPFAEVTSEIAARTSPTALDLVVACFCALAAGFTTIRSSSDTMAAAAGTAIGIALVPPLCVSGFGLGLLRLKIFGGALLLFTANFCAILLFTVLLFLCTGFNMIDVDAHEAQDIESTGVIAAIAARLRRLFGTKMGPAFRFFLPVLLLAAVYLPLRQALAEVQWRIETKSKINEILRELTPEGSSVTTNLKVDQHSVVVRLVLMASREQAREIKRQLELRIGPLAGVQPNIEVVPVPDFDSLQQISDASMLAIDALPSPSVPVETAPDLDDLYRRLKPHFVDSWPQEGGTLLSWSLKYDADQRPVIEVFHTGDAIGSGEPWLEQVLSEALDVSEIDVRDHAVKLEKQVAARGNLKGWLPKLARVLGDARHFPGVHACVTRGREVILVTPTPTVPTPGSPASEPPERPRGARAREEAAPEPAPTPAPIALPDPAEAVADSLIADAGTHVEVSQGERWTAALSTKPCQAPPASPPASPPAADVTPPPTSGATAPDAAGTASEPPPELSPTG